MARPLICRLPNRMGIMDIPSPLSFPASDTDSGLELTDTSSDPLICEIPAGGPTNDSHLTLTGAANKPLAANPLGGKDTLSSLTHLPVGPTNKSLAGKLAWRMNALSSPIPLKLGDKPELPDALSSVSKALPGDLATILEGHPLSRLFHLLLVKLTWCYFSKRPW